MRLIKARLVNVCQHVDKTLEFQAGLTIICGPNGSGKSNFVNMVRVGLTNSFNTIEGLKTENIRRGTRPDETSYVSSTWEVASGEMTVIRMLQGGKSSVSLNGRVLARDKEDDVTNKVLELMGVSRAIVDDFMFASQDRLQEAISGSRAERAALFQSLCGLDKLKLSDRLLQDSTNQDIGAVSVYDSAKLDTEEAAWAYQTHQYRTLQLELSELRASVCTQEELNAYYTAIEASNRLRTLRDSVTQTTDRLRKNRTEHATVQEQKKQVAIEIQQADADKQANSAEYITLSNQLKTFDSLIAQNKTSLESAKYQAVESKAAPQRPVEEFDQARLDEVIKKKATLTSSINHHRDIVKNIEAGKWAECPTCGTPVSDLSSKKAEFAKKIVAWQNLLTGTMQEEQKLNLLSRQWREYQDAFKQWTLETQMAKKYLAMAATATSIEVPSNETYSSVKSAVASYDKLTKAADQKLQSLRQQERTLIERAGNIHGRIQSDEAAYHQQTTELAMLSTTSYADITQAEQEIERYNQLLPTINLKQSALDTVKMQLSSISGRLRMLRQAKRKTAKLRKFIELQSAARSVLHRDRLPSRIISGMLQQTVHKINEYLLDFGMPFIVEADPQEFSFQAILPNGDREPANRLSVGQKVTLAIAFWLARSAVFVGRLPFFSLDEPTAHLDEQRVMQSVGVFQRLAAELSATNRQGIVITHHRSLATVANTFIDLSDG